MKTIECHATTNAEIGRMIRELGAQLKNGEEIKLRIVSDNQTLYIKKSKLGDLSIESCSLFIEP